MYDALITALGIVKPFCLQRLSFHSLFPVGKVLYHNPSKKNESSNFSKHSSRGRRPCAPFPDAPLPFTSTPSSSTVATLVPHHPPVQDGQTLFRPSEGHSLKSHNNYKFHLKTRFRASTLRGRRRLRPVSPPPAGRPFNPSTLRAVVDHTTLGGGASSICSSVSSQKTVSVPNVPAVAKFSVGLP